MAVTGQPRAVLLHIPPSGELFSSALKPGDIQIVVTEEGSQPMASPSLAAPCYLTPPGVFLRLQLYFYRSACQTYKVGYGVCCDQDLTGIDQADMRQLHWIILR